ncbi:MAG: dihydroorotase, partial [Actinobacteria bacterium]|nr:dihydroorotase [Actinomycetota bacterium]
MLLTNCNLDGNPRLQSLRIVGELVSEIAPNLARVVGEEVIDAGGLLLTSSLTEP